MEEGSSDDDSVDPNRVGSCNDRLPFPEADGRVTGQLAAGGSLSEGSCGGDGPEDAYVLVPQFDTDITIFMDALNTDFSPVLRVEASGCGGDGEQRVCDRGIVNEPYHFLARAGVEYTVTIDAPSGASGDYAFDVVYGFPDPSLCPIHPETITQVSGATFIWENTFSAGQGRVDGYCGGPGRENMFALNTSYAGAMFIQVTGANGYSPAVSYRSSCAALSELACAGDADTGIPGVAELEAFIEGPGQFFIVVDQTGMDGGDYSLLVEFE